MPSQPSQPAPNPAGREAAPRPRSAAPATGQGRATIVIACSLQPELVEQIRAVDPDRLEVIHQPDLLPTGPYAGGYMGTKPVLDEVGRARWRETLARADILFEFDWEEPSQLRERAPRVQWVQASKSGIGEFLRRTRLDRSGITFCTAAGVHAVPLAEWTVFGALWLTKQLPRILDQQRRHHWEQFEAGMLRGQRAMVVGLGGVGREIARSLDAMGVEVWAVNRSGGEAPPHVARLLTWDSWPSALGEVDLLVLACPYTAETHHLVSADVLNALQPGAGVINVARGAVIDETALVEALRSGHLGGAVLDVQEVEPMPADSPLWDLPNVLVSPHRASIVTEENRLVVNLFCENLRRWLDGRPLRNVYDPAREY